VRQHRGDTFATLFAERPTETTKGRGVKSSADKELTFADGELIAAEGSQGREMFIVAEGRVRIVKDRDGRPVVLDVVERGDFFGEMALLESLPRFASAYAEGETRLVVIEPGGLLTRIRRDPTLAIEMLSRLSARLRQANSRLLAPTKDFDESSILTDYHPPGGGSADSAP
jgi:CRP/FNR family transcriptional regulator, cyclic AMP receptor protein